jgi:GxxExxY protein
MSENEISEKIISAAIEVHRNLGPGLLESIYQECLCYELLARGLKIEKERSLPVYYKGIRLPGMYRVDILVEDLVIIELKSVELIHGLHIAQTLTYLKLCDLHLGLLINFNVPLLKSGLKRVVNGYIVEES